MGSKKTWSVVLLLGFFVEPSRALDFDREIKKQERQVQVRYQRPPKGMAAFLIKYRKCRAWSGRLRMQCDQAEAKRRYEAYKVAWNERQRQRLLEANVSTGEMKISLEKKENLELPLSR